MTDLRSQKGGRLVKRRLARKGLEAVQALATRRIPFEFEKIPIRLDGMPYRKILNWIAVEAGIALRRREPWGRPTHLQIEPSSRCNLRCTYCPVGSETGPTGHMDADLFRKFVDDVHRHALLIVLWGWGEPFVCPSVYEMIDYAHRRGLRLVSSTNGHLFAKPEHADAVVRSGLDALIVSISGTTQEAYERFRGGNLDTALAGAREIVAQKRIQGSKTPHVQLSFIVTDSSEREIPELLDLARSLGVDGLSLKKMNTASVKPRPGPDDALPQDVRHRRFEYSDDGQVRKRVKRNPCKALWQSPSLRFDGRINPCVYDFDGDYVLGNARDESFGEIWSGARYTEMRRKFRDDWEGIPICDRCTYAFVGGNYDNIIGDTWLFDAD